VRETKAILLDKPLVGHDGPIKQIVLREPTFDEYLAFGDPYSVAYTENDVPFGVENPDVIRRYMDACLVEPKDPALLQQAGARVAREVKNALLGFFQPASATVAASETSPTKSPSPDTGTTVSTTSGS